jgi:23S rRNA-/tRNA-specific pseudouridylate synthase
MAIAASSSGFPPRREAMKAQGNRQKRWVVREGDGATVADIVRRAGEMPSAVEEGRVFLGRARVKSGSERVKPGDEVRIGAAAATTTRGADAARAPAASEVVVLWERDGHLACSKPAGLPTVPDHHGASHSLVALAAQSIGRKTAELFVTSRLDREVSGVVVFATTPEAEVRLRRARAEGRYSRRYVAIAASGDTLINVDQVDQVDQHCPPAGAWDAPIGAGKDPLHRAASGPDAKAARTRWTVAARAGAFAMLALEPETGRTHQIRVHASHAGAPLLGDRDYGGPSRVTLPNGSIVALARIALHAARVTVPSSAGEPLVAVAPIPPELSRIWSELGGAVEAWDRAISCKLEP